MSRGFTLLETLIAIAILTILMTIMLPSITTFVERQRVLYLVSELRNMLHQAKSEAISQDSKIRLSYINSATEWSISLYADKANSIESSTLEPLLLYSIPSFSHPSLLLITSISSLQFNSVRGTPHMPASFYLYQNRDKQVKLTIHNITGRVKSCSINGNYYGFKQC